MTFDPAQAFAEVTGEYSADDLQRTIEALRARYAAFLPAELQTRDLFDIAYASNWLRPVGKNRYAITVTDPARSSHAD